MGLGRQGEDEDGKREAGTVPLFVLARQLSGLAEMEISPEHGVQRVPRDQGLPRGFPHPPP